MGIFDVRHQPTAQLILQSALASTRTAHAYIFHGPEGVGKEMLAMRFAQLVMCDRRRRLDESPPEYGDVPCEWIDSCASCTSCRLAAAGTHPDFHVVHRHLNLFHSDSGVRARKAIDLGIDVIRQFVIDPAGKKPALCERKIFVLRECHRLTNSAQNALLKTLEEPPPDSYLFLLTHSLDHMLPTTRSRCQLVPFSPLPAEFVEQQLHELRPDAGTEQAHYWAHHECGSLGDALRWIDDGFYDCNRQLVELLLGLKRPQALDLASAIERLGKEKAGIIQQRLARSFQAELPGESKSGAGARRSSGKGVSELSETDALREALRGLLAMAATFYRDALRLAAAGRLPICNMAWRPALTDLAARLPAPATRQAIQAIGETEYQLKQNANARLCLEHLSIRLCRLHSA